MIADDTKHAPSHASFIPTALTLFRMTMGPAVAGLILWAASVLYSDPLLAGFIYALCLILFLLAALSDWLDGWLARKLQAVTPLGAALDHTADKVLVACVLIALAYASLSLPLVAAAAIIVSREVAVAGLREGMSVQGRSIPVGELGKWKAAAEMGGVAAYLAYQSSALLFGSGSIVIGLDWAARILIWSAVFLALFSGGQYAAAAFKRDA